MQPKVLFYLRNLAAGGAERVMVILANNFARIGAEVVMVIMSPPDTLAKELEPNIRLINLGTGRYAVGGLRLARVLRQERPHALLSSQHGTNFWAIQARRLARVPVRIVLREATTPTEAMRYYRRLKNRLRTLLFIRSAYPKADAVVAPSQGVRESLAALTGLPIEHIHLIYNPTITRQMPMLMKEPLNHPWFAPGEPPVILAVGRLVPLKGYATLIRAVARVRQQLPARLLILGEGEDRPRLEGLIRQLNLEPYVQLPGFDPNPFRYMARASVFVLSSEYEGMPNALIQALACGCPVVSTDCVSGPREVLHNGRYGRLVPVGDADALAAAIIETLSSEPPSVPESWLDQFREEHVFARYRQLLLPEGS